MQKATATAGSNIAFVKYWGQRHAELRLPANNSISMTLDRATTTTTLEYSNRGAGDVFVLNGRPASAAATARVSHHLDHIRRIAGVHLCARVESVNSFPTGAGIASSASGFAALTVAGVAALGLALGPEDLSRLARLASGSACRSIWGGFVEWIAGARHEDSYARQIAAADHWQIYDVIAVVSGEPKEVPSEAGHARAATSPFYGARLATLHESVSATRAAIYERDFHTLGEIAEAEALSLHAVAMTSRPSILYWSPGTVAVLQAVHLWREQGLDAYFTMDAGPNVHVLTMPSNVDLIVKRLEALPEVRYTIKCGPGEDAHLCDEHLF